MKFYRILLMILFIVGIASPTFAQHVLACKGTDQVLIGSSAVFQMEEGKVYQIIGFSASGNLVFATPFGPANYSGDRLRVTDGGQYGSAYITLRIVKATGSEWTGVLTNDGAVPVVQCYAAVQWRSASPQVIGTLYPGSSVTINIKASAQGGGGAGSFHLWSGENEIKPRIIEGTEW
jgi:hypothetical protein